MDYKYGEIPRKQVHDYKSYLHTKVHWMLLYKDPKLKEQYKHVDISKYITSVQRQLDGLNELFNYSPQLLVLMTLIEKARQICEDASFDFRVYRSLLLDAHSVIDELPEG